MRTKITTAMAIGLMIVAMAGCGGGGGGRGSVIDPAVSTGDFALRGTVYAPAEADVSASRAAGRSAALSKSWRGQAVAGAQITLHQMKKDGTLEQVLNASATADSSGKYTIKSDGKKGNYVVVANKKANIKGTLRTMFIKKMISLSDEDITAGSLGGADMDAASTLAVQTLTDILETINAGRSVSEQIEGDALAPETIQALEGEVAAALDADQESGSSAVDVLDVLSTGTSGSKGELQKLENSANGAGLKNKKDNAANKSQLRVKVVATPGGPVADATVTLTINGVTYTETTNEKGEAFFDALEPGSNFNLHVTKDGFEMKGSSGNSGNSGTVNNINIKTVPVTGNQAPVAMAGSDITVLQGSTVTLDGSKSFDPDGDSITYTWTQVSGPSATVTGTTTSGPVFTPAEAGTYVFGLTVSDGSLSSELDTVTITVGAVACATDADCNDSNVLTLDSCSNPGTAQAACVNTPIVCNVDGDCDSDTPYCLDGGTVNSVCYICKGEADCDDGNALTLDVCNNAGAAGSFCSHNGIVCNSDADCPGTTPYCMDAGTTSSACVECATDAQCDDSSDYTLDACADAGTTISDCTYIQVACLSNADCDDTDNYTIDTCDAPGTAAAACSYQDVACLNDADCDDSSDYTLDSCANAGTALAACGYQDVACLGSADCDDFNAYTLDACDNPGTAAAACSYQDVACLNDADCNDSSDYTVDACDNPGTAASVCSYQDIACLGDTDCDDSNAYTLDSCVLPGSTSSSCDYQDILCLSNADCNDSDATTTDTCENAGTVASACYHYKALEWLNVSDGSFTMGCDTCFDDEAPKHSVNLTPYEILKHEVTNAQYKECVDAGTCTAPAFLSSRLVSSYFGNHTYDDFPVVYVNWSQADTFCQWTGGRLPTEAEWEMAARGPNTSEVLYPWGNTAPTCTEVNGKISATNCVGDTVEVGSYAGGASYYGLMDMSGNVAEWVKDWYTPLYYGTSPTDDPQGPVSGSVKVVRGGNWGSNEDLLRLLTRSVSLPTYTSNSIGIRCAKDVL